MLRSAVHSTVRAGMRMARYSGLTSETGPTGITRLNLARPQVHNAFDEALMAALTDELRRLDGAKQTKVVILGGEGKSFSAGADLNYMARMASMSEEENRLDSGRLAELMRTLNSLSKPTIALVQGTAFGGGVGLAACCDIAIASRSAKFCLSEVKLGLIPAVISPYCLAAMGERALRRYALTAEVFSADAARECGLVHEVVATDAELGERGMAIASGMLANGPGAMAAAKRLVQRVRYAPIDAALIADTAARIAAQRVGPEAKERIGAFLAKTKK